MTQRGRLLITGGRGMVGRNLREHPAAAEWEILAPGSDVLDLCDARAVEDYLAETRPDAIVHAAGRVGGIQANMAHPVAFLEENMAMGRSVVLGAWKAGVRRLVNLASTCMYPAATGGLLTEDLILSGPLEPTNEGYALAKIMTMRLCEYIRREDSQAQFKTLIPCNLYGRHDKFDPQHSHLVPAIIHKVHLAKQNGDTEVEIWGDGTARREFLYAGDLAGAVLRALDGIETLPDLMNIGVGHDHSINDYYASIARIIGWQGRFVHNLSRPVGMKKKLSSTRRQEEWGWQAPTTLDEGIAKTYTFYLERAAA